MQAKVYVKAAGIDFDLCLGHWLTTCSASGVDVGGVELKLQSRFISGPDDRQENA